MLLIVKKHLLQPPVMREMRVPQGPTPLALAPAPTLAVALALTPALVRK